MQNLCKCGCGLPAPIAKKTSSKKGWIKGQAISFICGHNGKLRKRTVSESQNLCQCGCGHKSGYYSVTDNSRGIVKGQPRKFLPYHHFKKYSGVKISPLCQCGCGEMTDIAKETVKKFGWIKGQPKPYKRGHNRKHRKLRTDTHAYCSYGKHMVVIKNFPPSATYCHKCRKEIWNKWRAKNPEKYLSQQRRKDMRKRARKILTPGYFTHEQLEARINYYGRQCAYCGGPYQCIDHVKPVSKGGSNWPCNLRPSCISCNSRKSDKLLFPFKNT